jgi:FtsH-binding integral membrane protein
VVEVHEVVGALVLALNLIAGLWGVLVYRGRLAPGRAFEQALALSHTVVVGQTLLGLYLLSTKHRAPVQLHYVYGAAPALAILFAYSSRTEDARRNTLVFAVIALVIAAIAGRAFMTGKGWG